ncbi:uncharacterized protein LOC118756026 [Rhagoletis pomonella]|uniref:uncharacterized protein LOC118756026 n=1 Tax=Rhagoletis pomonella TaxID=28610 RepID=UPI001783DEBA|nr:uncharacterized protein LOC118756026 [Rhagoletis pomonella]
MSDNLRNASALPANDLFSSQSSSAPIPTTQANGARANLQYSPNNFNFPKKLLDLPDFSGRPEDWPVFYAAFMESTAAYGYSNFDNNQRLQRCLKGDALEVQVWGPEQLVRSQLAQVKEIAPISENFLSKLIPFATKVKNVCAFLQSAGAEHHISNPMLLDELIAKLPMSKRIEWGSDWLTSLANVICTVNDECQHPAREPKRRMVLHLDETMSRKCPLCQGQHKPADCKRLIEATVSDRWTEVKSRRLCFACLNAGHTTSSCRRRKLCGIDGCNRAHHRLLHEFRSERPSAPPTSSSRSVARSASSRFTSPPNNPHQQPSRDKGATVLSCATNSPERKLLYRILPVTLYGKQRRVDTYALLDEGSSITMLDSSLAKELDLQGRPHSLHVQWFGGHAVQEPATLVDLHISGAGMKKRHSLQRVHAVRNLQLPTQSLSRSDLILDDKEARHLPMQPHSGATPRLLIGIDNCHLGLSSTTITMRKNGPFAANTELGWVVFGPVSKCSPSPITCLFVNSSRDEALHDMVADFFETESFGVRPSPPIESEADIRARAMLESTTCRVGPRFQTGLLWKHDDVQLPDSYGMALNRLRIVERKMSRDVGFAVAYKQIIDSYLEKGYARRLATSEYASSTPRTWYLPHFAVVNPNKPFKLRIVFDAAAEVNGISLNSRLLKGPEEYKPQPSILFRFRETAVGLCGDIREMFNQVLIRPEDRRAQRFLWRDGDSGRTPDVYEMRVMTFGAACSPCAAHYVKTRNALERDSRYTARAITAILENHYVDDFVDSFNSPRESIDIGAQVRAIHMGAGFELRNFTSNSTEVIAALDGVDVDKVIGIKNGLGTERVLGLHWHSTTDNFKFGLKFNNVSEAVMSGTRCPTKRELLSVVMSIFDPLGFLGNFVVGAKLLMREVWRHETRWDEPLPVNIAASWEKWRRQLPSVVWYTCPRFYFRNGAPESLQLHTFGDASENAFAAVTYWRAKNARGEVEVAFICAKSKCAPLKPLTVPRLELQAAVLGTRLQQAVCEAHSFKPNKRFLWCDSTTVIKWVRSKHRKYKPFVQHRIAEVLATTQVSEWRWIPTAENVADEATRANHAIVFGPTGRWVLGPSFLREEEHAWPSEDAVFLDSDEYDEELRPQHALTIVVEDHSLGYTVRQNLSPNSN